MYTFSNVEQEWIQTITTYRNRLIAIPIPNDITPVQAKHILSELDSIYSLVRPKYGDVKSSKDNCDSLIERVRRKAEANGSNTEKRKASGIEAVEGVPIGDDVVNLYEIQSVLNKKKEDLDSLLDIIKRKQEMIITMSGLLKVESQIVGH